MCAQNGSTYALTKQAWTFEKKEKRVNLHSQHGIDCTREPTTLQSYMSSGGFIWCKFHQGYFVSGLYSAMVLTKKHSHSLLKLKAWFYILHMLLRFPYSFPFTSHWSEPTIVSNIKYGQSKGSTTGQTGQLQAARLQGHHVSWSKIAKNRKASKPIAGGFLSVSWYTLHQNIVLLATRAANIHTCTSCKASHVILHDCLSLQKVC